MAANLRPVIGFLFSTTNNLTEIRRQKSKLCFRRGDYRISWPEHPLVFCMENIFLHFFVSGQGPNCVFSSTQALLHKKKIIKKMGNIHSLIQATKLASSWLGQMIARPNIFHAKQWHYTPNNWDFLTTFTYLLSGIERNDLLYVYL